MPDGFPGALRGGGSRAPLDPQAYAEEVAKAIKADVRMFSGCMDCQTSADVPDVSRFGLPAADGAGGACTHAMLATLEGDRVHSWLSLLKGMQATLAGMGISQVPQLSASRRIDVKDPFTPINPETNGRTRSLLIGINYVGQQGQLSGCHNDVEMMKRYIITHGFSMRDKDCKILADDGVHENPTHDAIIRGFRWLVAGAARGDSLFMHYSGHGSKVVDVSGDEADGWDETLVPVDYREAGQIIDDIIFEEVVVALPAGVTMTVVMDCCHSGSVLDLPYELKADLGTIEAVEANEMPSTLSPNSAFLMGALRIAKEVIGILEGEGRTSEKFAKVGKLAKREVQRKVEKSWKEKKGRFRDSLGLNKRSMF